MVTKNSLTRDIKRMTEYVNDLREAYNYRHRYGGIYGWYLGDKIYHWTVRKAEIELKAMIKERKEMDKPQLAK